MSRDLRSSIRDYSEPIELITLKKVYVDGEASTETVGEPQLLYANVMLNKDRMANEANGASIIADGVKITIANVDPELNIIPESSTLIVRGNQYIITKVDPFNINTETITV